MACEALLVNMSKLYFKFKNAGGMYQRYKNINLNKIQRSNERVSQDKESLERHWMIVFETKGPQIRCIPHGSFGLSQCKSSSKKTCWLSWKSPQIRCIHHGRRGLAQCKWTCEEHAGSDKSFANLTLCLDQLPLKIQFTKEKRTLKTLVLSREANMLPQCKSSCKEQAGSDKNLSVKPYFFKAVALNAIYKANQSTNCPFKLEIY